jgi:ethanolamine ammonia-lyase small subunit
MNRPSGTPADPWSHLRRHTAARIALGRAGGSLPTAAVLDFAAAHAAARDAVHSGLDADALEAALRPAGLPVVRLHSQCPDRTTYLQRPDLGRRLDEPSRARLRPTSPAADLALIVADGLSALAAQRQAPAVLESLVPLLRSAGIQPSPVHVVVQGRVAIADEVGAAVGARAAVILIGERPGLGSPDSLGAYLVFDPKPGKTDADRNCVSNIRSEGLPPTAAAETIGWLVVESLRRRISGVGLKDERGEPRLAAAPQPGLRPSPGP